jgi:tetratricopeptide (TPR) repeat protein
VKRLLLACTLLAVAAAGLYGYAVTRREGQFRTRIVDGDYAMARGDGFAAVSAFGDAIDLKPDAMLGYLKRGEARRRRGELDAATADLTRAGEISPSEPKVWELLGDVEAARKQFQRAAAHYRTAVNLDDRAPRIFYKLGVVRHLSGAGDACVDALARAVTLDGRFAEAHYLLGVCLREVNKPREAEQELKRAASLDPTLLAAREQLADLYDATNRRADRIEELEALLAADASPARHIMLALAYARTGQTQRAVRQLRAAAALHPEHAGVYLALGRVWLDAGIAEDDRISVGKAIEALQQAVAMDPTGEALAQLGKAHLVSADPVAAERTLRQATERLPVDPAAFIDLADAAERTGQAQSARRALLDFRALSPATDTRHVAVAERLGDLSLRVGEASTAVQWYTAATQASRATPALLTRLAQAQIQAGDIAGARATLTRIFEQEPENAAARALERRLK